ALGHDELESFADEDGIVCLPPLNHEQPAAARLRQLLTAAFGAFDERALIAAAGLKGSKSKTLEDWLRDEFFEQHAKLFHDRPFIWHIWDGSSDGFHALVNYHRLDYATLQKLTYSYLGNWIQQQSDDAKADKPGAAKRLGAAQALQTKLAAILEGEAPLDIFVRWKPIKDQAQGWHPDINDGIRQNIRPFLLAGDVGKRGAGLFRAIPLALKDKDRGTEPTRPKSDYPWFWCEDEPGTAPPGGKEFIGNRWNDVHLTMARKKEAGS
ncbi:MAG: SAM-dependent DNA methyltransferase, partial [Syntrophales bacterium]